MNDLILVVSVVFLGIYLEKLDSRINDLESENEDTFEEEDYYE